MEDIWTKVVEASLSSRFQLSAAEKLKEFIMEFLRKEILRKHGQFFKSSMIIFIEMIVAIRTFSMFLNNI